MRGMPATTRTRTLPGPARVVRRRGQRAQRLAAAHRPHRGECVLELGAGGTANFHARVAPWLEALRRIAFPRRVDAEATDESDVAIDHDGLAMIARQPRERTVDARRVEDPQFDAGFAQWVPERSRREGAQPVEDHTNAQACARLGREGLDEPSAQCVVDDKVALEQNVSLRLGDGVEPRGKVLAGVEQQAHSVAVGWRGARSASECVVPALHVRCRGCVSRSGSDGGRGLIRIRRHGGD